MSFFDPLLTSDNKPFAPVKYKSIISEQVLISYLSKGGVTYGDTENMTPYERKVAYDTLREIYDEQAKAQKNAIEQARAKREKNESKMKDPKSRLTSGR